MVSARSPAVTRAVVVSAEVAKSIVRSRAMMLLRGVRKRMLRIAPCISSVRLRASAITCMVAVMPMPSVSFVAIRSDRRTSSMSAVSVASDSRPHDAVRLPRPLAKALSALKSALAFPPALSAFICMPSSTACPTASLSMSASAIRREARAVGSKPRPATFTLPLNGERPLPGSRRPRGSARAVAVAAYCSVCVSAFRRVVMLPPAALSMRSAA